MTDPDSELKASPRVSQSYRELGAEEPPRALDEVILAAATRAARPWSRRWALPLSLAAVLVLSVTVTLRIQHEQPDIAQPSPAVPAVAEAKREQETKPGPPKLAEAPRPAAPVPFIEDKGPASRQEPTAIAAAPPVPREKPAPMAQPAPTAPPAAPAAELASRADQARSAPSSAAGAVAPQSAPAQVLAKRSMARDEMRAETPERELERIAELRRQGRHDEADKALADFRKRLPDYKIPEAMLERLERR